MKCNICNHFDAIDPVIGRCKSCAENLAKCYYLIRRGKIKAMPRWFENHWPIEHSMVADGMFLSHESCRRGHIGLKKIDGKCAICEISPTPRQAAINAGQTWYIPTEPCKQCGTLSLRRVSNSQCKHCLESAREPSPRQKAIAAGETWYIPTTPCKRCGELARRRTDNSQCESCAEKKRTDKPLSARQKAMSIGMKWYTPEKPCRRCGETALRHTFSGRCKGCERKAKQLVMPAGPKPLTARQQAIRDGKKWYMPDRPCPKCGQHAQRKVSNSQCSGCHPTTPKPLTARQQAIKEGKKWYMPDKPCSVCQTIALKRVDNGQCSSCQPPKRPIQEVDPSINLDPDTIIKRPNAKAAGLKYYRTGKPCSHGHEGFRYVSTGACVDCNKSLYNVKRCV